MAYLNNRLDERTLWRCAFRRWYLELGGLGDRSVVELTNLHRDTTRELPGPSRPGHLDPCKGCCPDLADEDAAVDGIETYAPPPPAGTEKRERENEQTQPSRCDCDEPDRGGHGWHDQGRTANSGRRGEPDTQCGGKQVRAGHCRRSPHGSRS